MGIKIKIIAFIIGLIFFIFIFMSIKKNNFSPAMAILWLLISIFLLTIPLFEGIYHFIAYNIIGINDARHIIYIFIIGYLLIYVFYLSSKITELSNQVKRLISNLATLEYLIYRYDIKTEKKD